VNVLVALFDRDHVDHVPLIAHQCRRQRGRFVTFGRTVPLAAVSSSTADQLGLCDTVGPSVIGARPA
jgi:hypothetical protein